MNNFLNDIWLNLEGYYDDVVVTLPKLIFAVLVFFTLYLIAEKVKTITTSRLSKKMDDPLLARFLGRMVKLIIVLITLMLALNIVGLSGVVTGLITGASVSAIVIGFAFKDIGENFLAGIMLAFNRPFRVGDTVELDGLKGKVISLDMRSTQIKSFDGKDFYIPNANVLKNPVVNYTIDGFLRNEFIVGLDYGSDVEKAIKIILDTIGKIEGILKLPKGPDISVDTLGASTLNLSVKYWIDTFDTKYSSSRTRTIAITNVLEALEREGFNLPGDIIELKNYNDTEIKTAALNKLKAS